MIRSEVGADLFLDHLPYPIPLLADPRDGHPPFIGQFRHGDFHLSAGELDQQRFIDILLPVGEGVDEFAGVVYQDEKQ